MPLSVPAGVSPALVDELAKVQEQMVILDNNQKVIRQHNVLKTTNTVALIFCPSSCSRSRSCSAPWQGNPGQVLIPSKRKLCLSIDTSCDANSGGGRSAAYIVTQEGRGARVNLALSLLFVYLPECHPEAEAFLGGGLPHPVQ